MDPQRSIKRSRRQVKSRGGQTSILTKEAVRKAEADRQGTEISKKVHESMVRDAQKETAHYKSQFEHAMELVENQKLSIKMLQDKLGAEETAQMRSVRRECEAEI